jgi:hypothetical protein
MPERSTHAHVAVNSPPPLEESPPQEVAEFIRFCHRSRPAVWPELYDVMCGVAARREFRGWGADQLAERGITFALPAMPLLAAWVRATVGTRSEPVDRPTPAVIGA